MIIIDREERKGREKGRRGKSHLCFLQKHNENMSLGLGYFIFVHSPDIKYSSVCFSSLKLSW